MLLLSRTCSVGNTGQIACYRVKLVSERLMGPGLEELGLVERLADREWIRQKQ